jgi:hypothetical protein
MGKYSFSINLTTLSMVKMLIGVEVFIAPTTT